MSLTPPPKFWGRITITAALNDRIDFWESNGGAYVARQATLTAGTYYPDDLATEIRNQMTAASGFGANYTVTYNTTTGVPTITGAGGALAGWYPDLLVATARKALTGSSATLTTLGANHIGWYCDAGLPAGAMAHTGDVCISHVWYPTLPAERIEYRDDSTVTETISLGGKTAVRDWSGLIPTGSSGYLQSTVMGWPPYLTDADRLQFETNFWFPYAKGGSQLRYYPDRTSGTYTTVVLTGDSLRSFIPERLSGYPYYRWSLSHRLYKP